MNVHPEALRKNKATAKKLATRKKGTWILPGKWDLIRRGHGSLYRYIARHPDEFTDFEFAPALEQVGKQRVNISIRDEHLKTFNRLTKQLGGAPTEPWLKRKGYTRLLSYMKNYPKLFGLSDTPKSNSRLVFRKRKK